MKLVSSNTVRGWDDPRLYTMIALRRRGIPPGAIRAFVAEVGVSDNVSIIQTVRLESAVRKYMERTVPRLMVVVDPVKVIIDNLPHDHFEEVEIDFLKGDEALGNHKVPFTRTIYIDQSDFREEDHPDFFRLAPGKTVGLLNVQFPIRCTSFDRDQNSGRVTTIHAHYEQPSEETPFKKPKAYIHWVAESAQVGSPIMAEVRIFHPLFKSANPGALGDDWLSDVNEHSEETYTQAMVEVGFHDIRRRGPWPKDHIADLTPGPWGCRFQGVRMAYFALDTDSTEDKIVLNKIVGLKEDVGRTT